MLAMIERLTRVEVASEDVQRRINGVGFRGTYSMYAVAGFLV